VEIGEGEEDDMYGLFFSRSCVKAGDVTKIFLPLATEFSAFG
jgi:hypothetical protein